MPADLPPSRAVTEDAATLSVTVDGASTATAGPGLPPPATRPTVPGYEIVRELGRGGMGVVYEAVQVNARRTVALKMILAGAAAGRADLARFQIEAEALARLQHPGIVQVYDVGEAGGLPYFALEFCDGGSLSAYLRNHRLDPREAAAAVEHLARAVDAAHRRQVVHRDLKPANVLLKPRDGGGTGLAGFDLKVADFGLAKQLDNPEDRTRTHAVMGTPRYMAPEQAAGGSRYVGPAADVHALGVILYEMLTGRPPFDGDTPDLVLEQVRTADPTPVRTTAPTVARDLETVALKCLRKDPVDRYPSAADLADDLHRFLIGEPIRARPAGRAERIVKWARRKPTLAAAYSLGSLVVVLGVFTAALAWLWVRAEGERRAAVVARGEVEDARGQLEGANVALGQALAEVSDLRDEEQRRAYSEQVRNAGQDLRAGQYERARVALAECPERFRGWEWHFLERQTRTGGRTIQAHGTLLVHVALNRDGSRVLTQGFAEPVKLWDTSTGRLIRKWDPPAGGLYTVCAYHPTEERVALVSAGELKKKPIGTIRLVDLTTGETSDLAKDPAELIELVAFSPDGRRLAAIGSRKKVFVWDWKSGTLIKEWVLPREGTGLAFGPDEAGVAISTFGVGLRSMNVDTGVETVWPFDSPLIGFAFHPKTRAPVARNTAGQYVDWPDGPDKLGRVTGRAVDPTKVIRNLVYHPDGRWLVAGNGPLILLRDQAGQVTEIAGHSARVIAADISGDGRLLATGSDDGALHLWDVSRLTGRRPPVELAARSTSTTRPVFSPDQSRIGYLTGGTLSIRKGAYLGDRAGKVLKEWNLPLEQEPKAFAPDLGWLAVVEEKTRLALVSTADEANTRTFEAPVPAHELKEVRFSPDGRWVAAWGNDRLTFWAADTGKVAGSVDGVRIPPGSLLEASGDVWFRPDGAACAVAEADGLVARSVPDGRILYRADILLGLSVKLAFSNDSKWFTTSSADRLVRICDAATGRVDRTLSGHAGGVVHVTFQPGGRRLASFGSDLAIRLWDLASGREVLTLEYPDTRLTHLEFGGPTGNRLCWVRNGNLEVADVDPPPGLPVGPVPPEKDERLTRPKKKLAGQE